MAGDFHWIGFIAFHGYSICAKVSEQECHTKHLEDTGNRQNIWVIFFLGLWFILWKIFILETRLNAVWEIASSIFFKKPILM